MNKKDVVNLGTIVKTLSPEHTSIGNGESVEALRLQSGVVTPSRIHDQGNVATYAALAQYLEGRDHEVFAASMETVVRFPEHRYLFTIKDESAPDGKTVTLDVCVKKEGGAKAYTAALSISQDATAQAQRARGAETDTRLLRALKQFLSI